MKTYQYIIRQEDFISRVPGLFPYINYNENGDLLEVTGAMSNIKSPSCWGKVIPDLKDKNGNIFSYRTLMNKYYNGELDKDFNVFVERAIGIHKVEKEFLEKHPLCPDIIYKALTPNLIKEYEYLHNTLKCYLKNGKTTITEDKNDFDFPSEEMCCLWTTYIKMGGDEFLDVLRDKLKEAVEISEEYLEYAYTAPVNNIPVILNSSHNDFGVYETYINRWVPGRKYKKGEYVTYRDPITGVDETYICNNEEKSSGKPNDKTETIDFVSDAFVKVLQKENKTLDEIPNLYTNSKLKGLRWYKSDSSVLNDKKGETLTEDYLSYYKVGYVTNIETTVDELGNIAVFAGEQNRVQVEGENETNLIAYGDVITEITHEKIDDDEYAGTITFKYVIGGHLNATLAKHKTDDDSNKLYFYDDFTYDNDSGVKYTDTFYYEHNSELDLLTRDEDEYTFNEIINIGKSGTNFISKRYEFVTKNSIKDVKKQIGSSDVEYRDIISIYEVPKFISYDEFLSIPLLRKDSLIGITYNPTVKSSIRVDRGNAAAFERHIKLGEIQTLEDLETYANGGFFNLNEYN